VQAFLREKQESLSLQAFPFSTLLKLPKGDYNFRRQFLVGMPE